ncbi:hypothetical protein GF340_05960 [Candidatus Peregrinibacteria bacterium]|nr:hypothetical protein [Candidatus Peregrinibacteria bacterium]
MTEKVLPTVESINISNIPDKKLGEFAVKQLLEGFAQVPEEKRREMLKGIKTNLEAFRARVSETLFHDSHALAMQGEITEIYDLQGTVKTVTDAVIEALEKVYSAED